MEYSVFKQQTALEIYADHLFRNKPLKDNVRLYLAQALFNIARGMDPKEAFGIKAGKGQRNSFKERMKIVNLQLAMGWIATAIEPKPELIETDDLFEAGLGLTVEEACYEASQYFNLSYDTLMHEWGNRSDMRKREFEIFYHPLKLK